MQLLLKKKAVLGVIRCIQSGVLRGNCNDRTTRHGVYERRVPAPNEQPLDS